MTSERKEPHLSGLDPDGPQERIPTLSERAVSDLFEAAMPDAPAPQPGGADLHRTLAETLGDDSGGPPRLADYDFVDEWTQMADEAAAHVEQPGRRTEPAAAPEARIEPAPKPAPEISAEDIAALSDRVLDQIAPALREAVTVAVSELLAARSRGSR